MTDKNNPQTKDISDDNSIQPAANMSLDWRIGIGLIAIFIIGYFVYSYTATVTPGVPLNPATAAPVVQPEATLTAPEATAAANPESAEAQFELGNAYYKAGQLEPAIRAYQQAIRLDPNHQAAYANLGVTYYQQQQFELAAAQYEKALELDPEDGDVAYNLGVLYLQQALSQNQQPDPQLLAQAVTQLQAARDISPNLAEPYFSLGVAHLALRQADEARQAFENYLAAGPNLDPRAKQEAENYLRMLQGQ